MAVSPVLLVKADESTVRVRARLYDDFSEHDIVLNSVLTYWWANNLPPALKFLELLDSAIKRTINEIMPHKILNLKYDIKANEVLEKASEIEIDLISVVADDVGFKLEKSINPPIAKKARNIIELIMNKIIPVLPIVLSPLLTV